MTVYIEVICELMSLYITEDILYFVLFLITLVKGEIEESDPRTTQHAHVAQHYELIIFASL